MPTITITNDRFAYVSETKHVVIPGCKIRGVDIENITPEPPSYAPNDQLYTYFKLTVRTNFYNGSEAFSFDLRTPIIDHPSWTNTYDGARFASDAIMSIAGSNSCCGGECDDCLLNIIVNNDGVEVCRFDDFDLDTDNLTVNITQA